MKLNKTILLIYPVDFNNQQNIGILHKMRGQGKALQNLGYNVRYAFVGGSKGLIVDSDNFTNERVFVSSFSTKFLKYHSFYSSLRKFVNGVDIVYLRHLIHTPSLNKFLRNLQNEEVRILYEYPTYPYADEWVKWWQKFFIKRDLKLQKVQEMLMDLVIHYGGYDGKQQNVQISNGIDLPILQKNHQSSENEGFRLIAIGRWEYWHGLDRILVGMSHSTLNVHLDIVGSGPYSGQIVKLIDQLSLKDKVDIHGPLYNQDLANLISTADLGVGTLGLHRKNVLKDSSLKSRTYCSHGLPFLISSDDDEFSSELPFVFKVAADEDFIDIDELVEKVRIRKDLFKEELSRESIHLYAQRQLSWTTRMEKVLETLEDQKS